MVDELIKQVVLGAPNLAVALAILYWQSRRLDRMIDLYEKVMLAFLQRYLVDRNGKIE